MLLPRSDPSADCSGHFTCVQNSNIPTDPASNDNDVSYLPRSGTYGYMGILMVVILALLACTIWLHCARQRAKRAKMREANEPKAPASKTPRRYRFGIGRRKSSLSLPSPVTGSHGASPIPLSSDPAKYTKQISISETGKQPRWVSQSGVRKDLVKEVSGGMVVYTAPDRGSKPARPKPTAQPHRRDRGRSQSPAWQMEHVYGVRYGARTPLEGDSG